MQILRQASGVTPEHAHLGLMQGPLQSEVRVGEKKTNCSFLFSVPRVLRGPTEPGPPCACSWTARRGSAPPPTHPAIWTREHVKKTEPTPRLHPPPNQLQQPLHLKARLLLPHLLRLPPGLWQPRELRTGQGLL